MSITTISLEDHWKAVCRGEPLQTVGIYNFFGWHQNPESDVSDLRAYYRDAIFGEGYALTHDEVLTLIKGENTFAELKATANKMGQIMLESYEA